MDNPVAMFSNAIDQTFPDLDSETKENIREKVLGYVLVRLEEESYRGDPEGARELQNQMKTLDDQEKSKLYGEEVGKKFSELPETERKAIMKKMDSEIIGIMNKIYQETQ